MGDRSQKNKDKNQKQEAVKRAELKKQTREKQAPPAPQSSTRRS